MSEKVCYTCGGVYSLKWDGKECPECHTFWTKNKLPEQTEKSLAELTEKAESIYIPAEYVGSYWSLDKLMKTHPLEVNQVAFQKITNQMDKIHDIFIRGDKLNSSVLLVAPPRFSKVTWAYSIMQLALEHGLTVAPMLSTIELKRLFLASVENPKYRLSNKMTIEDYMTADVVVVTVTKTDYRGEAYSVILEILDARSRRNLPTIILSRFNTKEIAFKDYHNHFESIKDFNGDRNKYKYPAIMEYIGLGGK